MGSRPNPSGDWLTKRTEAMLTYVPNFRTRTVSSSGIRRGRATTGPGPGGRVVGPETAVALLITVGDNPERLDSEASFAALCGVSPVERSSGRRQYRRLNRGGDRQANAALHRIVLTRPRVDPRTQGYYERRIKEGKTRREIVRCLKRYAAREVFHLVEQIHLGPRS